MAAARALRLVDALRHQERFDYQIVNDFAGDIEHLYRVRFGDDGEVRFDYAALPIETHKPRFNAKAAIARMKAYTPQEFTGLVNKDRNEINAFLAARGNPARYEPVTA